MPKEALTAVWELGHPMSALLVDHAWYRPADAAVADIYG